LSEKHWLKDKAEAEAREKARDKERLTRKEPAEKVYELTVKQAALPGLPPPVEKTNSIAKLDKPHTVGGGGPNLAAVTPTPKGDGIGDGKSEEDAADAKPAAVDVELAEAEHILVDYLSALGKTHALTSTTPTTASHERN
jgi:hypothetical protein